MESIIGIKFDTESACDRIKCCSELSAFFFTQLVKNHKVTYSQILYPYADALSISGNPGAKSTRIFGTHILLRGVDPTVIKSVLDAIMETDACERSYELVEFRIYDGAVMAVDIAEFLNVTSSLPGVGEFSAMMGGFVPHWHIRECARVFASFSEMAYRRAKGAICGLEGGRLIVSDECDCAEALCEIFTQKTGCR